MCSGVVSDFGDHTGMTTSNPGKAHTNADPCRTKQYPDYFGHTNAHTGVVTIAARLTFGPFRMDGGAWRPMTGTVSAAAASIDVHVK